MANINSSGSSADWEVHIVLRPVTISQIAWVLEVDALRVIAQLAGMGFFAPIGGEIPDDVLFRYGSSLRVHFKTIEDDDL